MATPSCLPRSALPAGRLFVAGDVLRVAREAARQCRRVRPDAVCAVLIPFDGSPGWVADWPGAIGPTTLFERLP